MSVKANWRRICIFCTFGTNGLSEINSIRSGYFYRPCPRKYIFFGQIGLNFFQPQNRKTAERPAQKQNKTGSSSSPCRPGSRSSLPAPPSPSSWPSGSCLSPSGASSCTCRARWGRPGSTTRAARRRAAAATATTGRRPAWAAAGWVLHSCSSAPSDPIQNPVFFFISPHRFELNKWIPFSH